MTPSLTDARLAEIRARCAAATPGPWDLRKTISAPVTFQGSPIVYHGSRAVFLVPQRARESQRSADDAAFLVNARQDIPDLLAEVERLRALEGRVKKCIGADVPLLDMDWTTFEEAQLRTIRLEVAADREACVECLQRLVANYDWTSEAGPPEDRDDAAAMATAFRMAVLNVRALPLPGVQPVPLATVTGPPTFTVAPGVAVHNTAEDRYYVTTKDGWRWLNTRDEAKVLRIAEAIHWGKEPEPDEPEADAPVIVEAPG